jgi:ribose transport system substrate-binding protein
MKVRTLLLVIVLLIPTALLGAGPITIGVSLPILQHPFFAAMQAEAEKTAQKLGVKLVFVDAWYDVTKQASDLQDLATQKVDGILTAPMTVDALVPIIEKAAAAGIAVVTVDRKANTDKVLAHVGTDDVEGGRMAARYIIQKLGNKGTAIELEGSSSSSPAMERKRGFDEVIGNSNVKILASRGADFSRNAASQAMEELIKIYPAFDAVFAANDDMVLGAIDAMSTAGIDTSKKITIGWDASADGLAAVRQGRLDATIDSFPGQQASRALTILVDYIKNKRKPTSAVVYITPKLVTQGK